MPLSKFRPARLPVAVAAALLSAYSFGAGDGVEQVDLPTVQVKGIGKQTTNNYTIPASSATTGIRLTQRETPQSLSVFTEKQMDDQGLDT
ncbi:TonB-dependent siderophore receptor, partial [Neisseria sp. P0021.S004]